MFDMLINTLDHTEAAVRWVCLKFLQNSRKTPVSESLFLNKVAGLRSATSLKKETLAPVFSCEFC